MHDAPNPDIAARLEVARAVGAEAGALAASIRRSGDLAVVFKPDGSPVTRADKQCEALIRETITRRFPDDAIVGEEFGQTRGTSAVRWILDPIDGTKSYIKGIPTFGTLIGVEAAGRVVAGYAGFPALHEELWASAGVGAWHRVGQDAPAPARVSSCADLAQAIIDTHSWQGFDKDGLRPLFERLGRATQRCRGWNDAYSFALSATGRIDAAIGYKSSIWDLAPFAVILREAGGVLTDWQGVESIEGNNYVATNRTLLPRLLTVLQEHT